MSTIKANNHQIGSSATPNQNLTWYQPLTPDGTVRLGVGNAGATTSDAITVDNSGNVTIAGTLNSAGGQPVWHGVQATAQTTNGASAYGYTGIPSWVKKITVQINNVGGAVPYVQIGSGSYATTGYNGVMSQTTTSGSGYINNNSLSGLIGIPVFSSTAGVIGVLTLSLISAASNTWVASGTGTGSVYSAMVTGSITLSGTLDRVQITSTGSNFTGGSVNIIYEG